MHTSLKQAPLGSCLHARHYQVSRGPPIKAGPSQKACELFLGAKSALPRERGKGLMVTQS